MELVNEETLYRGVDLNDPRTIENLLDNKFNWKGLFGEDAYLHFKDKQLHVYVKVPKGTEKSHVVTPTHGYKYSFSVDLEHIKITNEGYDSFVPTVIKDTEVVLDEFK